MLIAPRPVLPATAKRLREVLLLQKTPSIRGARAAIRTLRQKGRRRLRSVMSATRSNPGEGVTPPHTSIVDNVYQFLSSVRFAILVLSFIAASCVVGTLIKQQAPPQEYLRQFSESTYAILKFLRLTDVFHAPWFLFLAGLFVVNLVFCTIDRLGRFLKSGREAKIPSEKTLTAMANTFVVRGQADR